MSEASKTSVCAHTPTPWTHRGQQVLDTSEHSVSVAYCGMVAGAGVCKDGKVRSFGIDEKAALANAAFIVEAVNNHDRLTAELEIANQKREFAEFEWNRATEHAQKRDAELEIARKALEGAAEYLKKHAERRTISALTKIAAECHRAKWKYSDDKDKRPFDDLHRIGDEALKLRDQIKDAQTIGMGEL